MIVQIWKLPMNNGYKQPVEPTIFVISRPNLSSNIIKLYINGF